MTDKATYQELDNQITDLIKKNEILLLDISIQNKEKTKRADELVTANIELDFQNKEKTKRAAELVTANVELDFQNEEKTKRAAELVTANIELVFQNGEKEKRAAELIISKIKLAQQGNEKEKLEEALLIANMALDLQSELVIAKEKAEANEIQLRALNITKDKLFSIIGHDLKNPLISLLGFSKMLIENIKTHDTKEIERYLNIINSSTENSLILLDNLLNWAKSQTGQISFNPKKILFSAVILETIKLETSIAKFKNIAINYSTLNKVEVYTDENMLKTILRNLISNALKFTPVGGHINVNAISTKDHVEISISDNGIGMNAEKIETLFKIGLNTSSLGTANEKGSGLGLTICKEFIAIHKGEIWVESKEGYGSNFKFTLPFNSLN